MFDFKGLTKLQAGRVESVLNKVFRFKSGVMTRREFIETCGATHKEATNKAINWNRRRFNCMNYEEQSVYEVKMLSGRLYWVCYGDGLATEVPKIIFKALTLPDKTDINKLGRL